MDQCEKLIGGRYCQHVAWWVVSWRDGGEATTRCAVHADRLRVQLRKAGEAPKLARLRPA